MILAQTFTESLRQALADVATFLPKFIGFLAILIIGYFVAKILARVIDRVLERAGFDRAVQRGGINRVLSRSKYDASGILSKLVFYAVMLFVLQMAFGVFGDNPISDLIYGVISYLPKVFAALLIIVVAAAIAAAVREIVDASLGGLSYGRLLAGIAGGAILAIGVFAALSQLEIAPGIINAVFYAILAIIAGSAIVAIGGGGIQPMRAQWEKAMQRVETEAPAIREEARGSGEDIRQRAETRRDQARSGGEDDDRDGYGTPERRETVPGGSRSRLADSDEESHIRLPEDTPVGPAPRRTVHPADERDVPPDRR